MLTSLAMTHRTHHLPNAEQIRYMLCHRRSLYYNKMFQKIWYENIFVKFLCEFKVLLEINKHSDQSVFKSKATLFIHDSNNNLFTTTLLTNKKHGICYNLWEGVPFCMN